MNQKNIFLPGEGNMWYQRNKSAYTPERYKDDLILTALEQISIQPSRVLEIGCANGWRLAELYNRYGCEAYGIDPSEKAIMDGKTQYPYMHLSVGTADDLPKIEPVDLIIFGFCLYLCDPKDLFKIAMESDKLLSDHGYIAILDFHPLINHYRNKYSHKENIYSYKMDYSTMFSWHPAYCRIYQQLMHHNESSNYHFKPDELISIQLLRKESFLIESENPFRHNEI